ncbi:hypothetical protein ASPZODRAFT_64238 [Penicilliopsis zonata CBS 506.65]|uniref:PSP1 C-terminal domain-containing protein n=1 Tax=Penicilliopsis zonata CBS 506.65 TaxID=1073090 RepID=A0A1L9SKL0_9EURO|nr:hypothetical protein ASPZODRAFT_64238 [Penicilliopsis zonata CBS 506.65]OJJ47769.1 hypothetical protein ASPZODRAFT_64238 [Penicilliopsis zonata CBS 506.65]
MAAPSSKPAHAVKATVSPTPTNSVSARLEKSYPGVRRSTPDSEALASSDDDGEQPHFNQTATAALFAAKPARRTSWLNEVPLALSKKTSMSATGPLSAGGGSNPTSPAIEQPSWLTTSSGMGSAGAGSVAWAPGANSSFSWGSGIWNSESRKEPPPRLAELVPSPTMTSAQMVNNNHHHHHHHHHLAEEMMSPTSRTFSGEPAIPFSIPLHPTPKTYRSQSYSVGQMDPEFLNLMATKAPNAPYPPPTAAGARSRGGNQFSALQHRSSRPSLLGELGHDPAMLGRVREDDNGDDEEGGSANGSDGSLNYSAHQARTIEQLSRENALLRQAAGQMDSRLRDRAMSSTSVNSGYPLASVGGGAPAPAAANRIRGSLLEETDLAVEDLDELGDIPGYGNIRSGTRRRLSEHSSNLEKQFPTSLTSLENRTLENVKKAHWQTSLGFSGVADLPQSRRHSFADIPVRHPSISAPNDAQVSLAPRSGLAEHEEAYATPIGEGPLVSPGSNREYDTFLTLGPLEELRMKLDRLHVRMFAENYFSPEQVLRAAAAAQAASENNSSNNNTTTATTANNSNNPLHPAYAMAPHPYGRPQSGLLHSHQNQLLYIVTFKCHRADVFYIQEDTGLQVKAGDLVIVEADRGTDLGTVQHSNISLPKARELKQQYAEEHYKWLMMFSRQGQTGGASTLLNPSGGVSNLNRSAIGGMGPHGHHGAQDSTADIKPKLIKRLAQNHEILTLRDKEGNEAKAKRVCQQKVVEHRLNMEILDAEFQMDWKKLTFYYFADSYINFNSLVTDLFKIYKTRIWMSAINPASFVTPPTAGLLSGGGPHSPLGYNQDVAPTDRRTQRHDSRSYGGAVRESFDAGRDGRGDHPSMGLGGRGVYPDSSSYASFHQPVARQHDLGALGGFPSPMHQAQPDPFSAYSSAAYGNLDSGYLDYADHGAGAPRVHPTQSDYVNRFQGLSLGS